MDGNGGEQTLGSAGRGNKKKPSRFTHPLCQEIFKYTLTYREKREEKNQTNEQTSIYSITSDLGALENKITSSSSSSG